MDITICPKCEKEISVKSNFCPHCNSKLKNSIFLSHNRNDKPFVRKVYRKLIERGIKTWYDEAEILPGDSLITKMEQGLSEMDFLGAFLSPDSIKSFWVKKEINIVLSSEMIQHKVRVIPILINNLKDSSIPPMLSDKYYIDFRPPHPFEKGIHEILLLLDNIYSYSMNRLIEILEKPSKEATALVGFLDALGFEEFKDMAEPYKYYEIYEQMGIDILKLFQMFKLKPEGAVERLARALKKDLPYPLWQYLASPDILRMVLRAGGEDV